MYIAMYNQTATEGEQDFSEIIPSKSIKFPIS